MQQNDSSPTRLRQIALVVSDLSAAERLLNTVLGTKIVFRDAQVAKWGLENMLIALGGDFIEVVSPFQDGTAAGRLLTKRGDGGYMIIMQAPDAAARREYILSRGLSNVIYSFSRGGVDCVQYHPRGIPGGMMPELDSHQPSPENPEPLLSPFSPWHASGPDHDAVSAAMRQSSYLRILRVICRLKSGDSDTENAAKTWERIFGVNREGDELVFTNARLKFVKGVDQMPDGLESITIGVDGKRRYEHLLKLAEGEGVFKDGCVFILGIQWHFVMLENDMDRSKI